MKKACTVVCFLFVCFFCGCSSAARNESREDCVWRESFHKVVMHQGPLNGTFTMELVDVSPLRQDSAILPYPVISCTPKLSGIPEGKRYILYCPNTGCPVQPEYMQKFTCGTDGEPSIVLSEDFQAKLDKNKITMKPLCYISLWGNPGFCSDWYFFPEDLSAVLHTTFVYEPIIALTKNGKTLRLIKKNPAGTILRYLSGFAPREKVGNPVKDVEGVSLLSDIVIDEQGLGSFTLNIDSFGKGKGTLTLSITSGSDVLTVSSDWDASVLSIKRKQPYSSLREVPLKRFRS